MMTLLNRLLLVALLLAVSATAFQAGLYQNQRRSLSTAKSSPFSRFDRSFATKASPDDKEEDKEVTDLDKATYQIAKEYDEKGGVPANDSAGGPKIDVFSIFLGLYVVFVIVDTVFHITPEENYSTALANGIRGLFGGGDN